MEIQKAILTGAISEICVAGTVATELSQRLHLALQPQVELVAQLTAVHLVPCRQRAQLLHQNLQAGHELELLSHDIQLPAAAAAAALLLCFS